MKVLIYSSAFYSDSTLPLYKEMLTQGVDVTLLFDLTRPSSNLFEDKTLLSKHEIFKATEYHSMKHFESYCDMSHVYVDNNPYSKIWGFQTLRSALRVCKFIEEGGYDVIHTDILFMFGKLCLLRYRNIMVRVIHEPIPHARKTKLVEKFFRSINYKQIPKFVVLNHLLKDPFCEKFGIEEERVLANRLGPLDCISVYNNKQETVNRNKIVFWGRITRYKGVDYLLRAMVKVHDEIPEAQLMVVGGGAYYFDISPYVNLPYIRIINRFVDLEELAAMVSDCAFTICPYLSSSQSGSVITSMVMGKPVLGTDIEAMHEMIEDGKTGLLVPPQNEDKLAEAIVRLIKDETLLDALTKNVKEKIRNDDTWTQVVKEYLAFYQKQL